MSYRRTQRDAVAPVVAALRNVGIECFFDVEDIDALADFPDRIREGLDSCHAMLVWWSIDYSNSEFCLAEFRRAWQHARRRSSDVGRRIWIVNPELAGDHIFAGELNAKNFLMPPAATADPWARELKARLDALLPEGPLADERHTLPTPVRRNVPRPSAEFVGRGAALLRVHSKFFPPQLDASQTPGVQLHGMGGLGKTELAAKYAETFAAAYPAG